MTPTLILFMGIILLFSGCKNEDREKDDETHTDVLQMIQKKLDSVQKVYKVTNKEFEQAPKEKVEQAYKLCDWLRGKPIH